MAKHKTEKPTPAEGRNVGGRPRKEIDYDTLGKLCAIFCTGDECAEILGMSYETLNNRLREDFADAIEADPDNVPDHLADGFLDYFKKHSARGRASLRKTQFKLATDDKKPNPTMLIWLGKQHLGQKDKVDHSSGDGTMTPKGVDAMTREQVEAELEARGLPKHILRD